MKKTPTAKSKYQPEKQWLQMLTIFVVVVGLVVAGIGLWRLSDNDRQAKQSKMARETNQREQRIEAIFDSFDIDESYKVRSVDIFGDKRIYAWDNGRTYASSIEYVRFEPVDKTVADARAAIELAGFQMVEEPYPDSISNEYHFKNDNAEFVRLSVTSREVNDAIMTGQPPKDADKNAAPSIVLIKVNLDDNNE